MERITVYTCITGGYDALMQPAPAPDGFDFVCFVSPGMKKSDYEGAWRIEEIPFQWPDPTLMARSQKLNPHSFLPEDCNWSLWIDGNIRIVDDSIYRLCVELQERGVRLAGIHHPFNDCPYREAVKCLVDRRESLSKLLKVITFLRREGVPEHCGMMETNVLFRKHNDPDVIAFDRWWWECLVHLSNRDQLTQSFALMDTPGLEADYLFPQGVSSRNYPGLEYVAHPHQSLNWLQRKLKYGLNKPKSLVLRSWIWLSRYFVKPHSISFENEK